MNGVLDIVKKLKFLLIMLVTTLIEVGLYRLQVPLFVHNIALLVIAIVIFILIYRDYSYSNTIIGSIYVMLLCAAAFLTNSINEAATFWNWLLVNVPICIWFCVLGVAIVLIAVTIYRSIRWSEEQLKEYQEYRKAKYRDFKTAKLTNKYKHQTAKDENHWQIREIEETRKITVEKLRKSSKKTFAEYAVKGKRSLFTYIASVINAVVDVLRDKSNKKAENRKAYNRAKIKDKNKARKARLKKCVSWQTSFLRLIGHVLAIFLTLVTIYGVLEIPFLLTEGQVRPLQSMFRPEVTQQSQTTPLDSQINQEEAQDEKDAQNDSNENQKALPWFDAVNEFIKGIKMSLSNKQDDTGTNKDPEPNDSEHISSVQYYLCLIVVFFVVALTLQIVWYKFLLLIGHKIILKNSEGASSVLNEYSQSIVIIVACFAFLTVFTGSGKYQTSTELLWHSLLTVIMVYLVLAIGLETMNIANVQSLDRTSTLHVCIRCLFDLILKSVMDLVISVFSSFSIGTFVKNVVSTVLPFGKRKGVGESKQDNEIFQRVKDKIDKILLEDVENIKKDSKINKLIDEKVNKLVVDSINDFSIDGNSDDESVNEAETIESEEGSKAENSGDTESDSDPESNNISKLIEGIILARVNKMLRETANEDKKQKSKENMKTESNNTKGEQHDDK